MTPSELGALRGEITARVDAALISARDTQAIAEALSVGRVRPTMREMGNGLVLQALGKDLGNVVLDIARSDESLRHVRPLLEQGRLVASSSLVAEWFDSLVASAVVTRAQADAVIALGHEPAPINELDVRRAAWSAEGDWLL